jgi:PleD family two-component response regulator
MINTIARVHSLDVVPSHLFGHPTWRPATPGDQPDTSVAALLERKTVLIVDDENLIADSVAEILNRNGYDAIARYNSTAAMQTIHDER